MTYLIRSATLTNYPEIARAAGLDPGKMLLKARLSPGCLDRPDMRIPVISVRKLLELSARESGVEEFGLRMADKGASTIPSQLPPANAEDLEDFEVRLLDDEEDRKA